MLTLIVTATSLDYLNARYYDPARGISLGAQAMSGFLYFTEETGFLTRARRV